MLVSLKEFIATGSFRPLTAEFTPAALESVFGTPEDTGGMSRKYHAPVIWKYGDFEFHFDRRSRALWLIHIDRFSGVDGSPHGWADLVIDPWIVRAGMPRPVFLAEITRCGLDFAVRSERQFNQDVVALASGVQIRFVTESEPYSQPVGLACLSLQMGT